LIKIGSKTAEKNSAQTNRQNNRHYENNGHLAVNQKKGNKWGSQANNVYSTERNQQMNQDCITPHSPHGANELRFLHKTCQKTDHFGDVLPSQKQKHKNKKQSKIKNTYKMLT